MAEFLGVVDDDDNVIGKATRDECHAKKLIHRSVIFFVFDKQNRVHVNKRSDKKEFFRGYWSIAFGGHIPAGEGYDEAVKREVVEETGLVAKPFFIASFDKRIPEEKENIRVYGVIADKPIKLPKDEIVYGEFMDFKELTKELKKEKFVPETEELYKILKNFLKNKKK